MSSVDDDSSGSLVSIAQAVRTRGLKGELVADLLTDFPDRFEATDRLIALSPSGNRTTIELERFWLQNDRIILKLAGVDSIEAAQQFVGYEFCVPEAERVQLEDGEYFDFELEGCDVRQVDGKHVGKVQRVLKTGGAAILDIADINGASILVPLAESIVTEIDKAQKKIVIDPPEGLLDL